MKIEKLLTTERDVIGLYKTVDDWQDVTVQVASTAKDRPFSGTITIEGTLDTNVETALWSPLLISRNEEILNLSGFSLAGLRTTASGMSAGEVVVLASGK